MSVGVIRRLAIVEISTKSTLWSTRWDVGAKFSDAAKDWERRAIEILFPSWPLRSDRPQRPGDFFACDVSGEVVVVTICGEVALVAAGDDSTPYCTELYLQEFLRGIQTLVLEIVRKGLSDALLASLITENVTAISTRVQPTVVGGSVSWLPFEDSK